jgi:hypothetical protein
MYDKKNVNYISIYIRIYTAADSKQPIECLIEEIIIVTCNRQQQGEDGVELFHVVGLCGVPDQAVRGAPCSVSFPGPSCTTNVHKTSCKGSSGLIFAEGGQRDDITRELIQKTIQTNLVE